jgi:hypothetical protein
MEIISIVLINVLVLFLVTAFIYAISKSKNKKETEENKIIDYPKISDSLQSNKQTGSTTHNNNLSNLSISKFTSSKSVSIKSKAKFKNLSNVKTYSFKMNQILKDGKVCKPNNMEVNKLKSIQDLKKKLDFQQKKFKLFIV